jgi:hypothetical protein
MCVDAGGGLDAGSLAAVGADRDSLSHRTGMLTRKSELLRPLVCRRSSF